MKKKNHETAVREAVARLLLDKNFSVDDVSLAQFCEASLPCTECPCKDYCATVNDVRCLSAMLAYLHEDIVS